MKYHNEYNNKRWYSMALAGLKGHFLRLFSVLVNQDTVHSGRVIKGRVSGGRCFCWWHLTCAMDTRHMTCDKWHLTSDFFIYFSDTKNCFFFCFFLIQTVSQLFETRGCSQIMSAKNEGVQTPPPPFVSHCQHFPNPPSPLCQLCQHLPNPPFLLCVSFVSIFNATLFLTTLIFLVEST